MVCVCVPSSVRVCGGASVWVPQGALERRVASKRRLRLHPGAYRAARKASWGGLWPDWLVRSKPSRGTAAVAVTDGSDSGSDSDSDRDSDSDSVTDSDSRRKGSR